jgi:hypothetical protein
MIGMSGTLPNPLWGTILREFGRRLESAVDLTVFGAGPGTVTPMPDALGGDPLQWPQLTQDASTATGFLNLLRAKAHFLVLPERILDDIRVAKLPFDFSGWFISGEAETRYLGNTVVAIRLAPDTLTFVAQLGAGIGRGGPVEPQAPALGTVYHELCHAWMLEIVKGFETWQRLERDGVTHYAAARVTDGTSVNPRAAYLEAAGSYVGARVLAWYQTLFRLAGFLAVKGTTPADSLATVTRGAREDYDQRMDREVYGVVGGRELMSPGLPPALREALDAQVLEGLPLTRPFDETPLRALYDAILAP